MSRTRFRFICLKSRSQVKGQKIKVTGQRSKSCISNNSKTTEANVRKLHGKIIQNEKVCCAQELGSYAQGQGHRSEVKIMSQQ